MRNGSIQRKRIVKDILEETKVVDKQEETKFNKKDFLSTGSTLLNLALSDHCNGGWRIGKMSNIIGDSSSGKSFLALSTLAEAAHSKQFDKYSIYLDDTEEANEFDITGLFGSTAADRIKAPKVVDGKDCYSDTIQDFFDNITDILEKGDPIIYILDSFDALDSVEEQEKFQQQKADRKKGKKVTGTFAMNKAKVASSMFRNIIPLLNKTNSILLIVSQTRDNIGMSFAPKTRSGGRALKFYSAHEMWLAHVGYEKKKGRPIGVDTKIKVTKNKITGKYRTVGFPIYYEYGIDNITSSINFLVEEGLWRKKGVKILSPEFGMEASLSVLIKHIEKNNLEKELEEIIQIAWNNIEDSLKLNRKRKYE